MTDIELYTLVGLIKFAAAVSFAGLLFLAISYAIENAWDNTLDVREAKRRAYYVALDCEETEYRSMLMSEYEVMKVEAQRPYDVTGGKCVDDCRDCPVRHACY